jgi:hypothetical protein
MSLDHPLDEDEASHAPTVPLRISRKFVALCEGDADRRFFKKLITSRNLPAFDIPYEGADGQAYNGNTAFPQMLRGLRGNRLSFSQVKGILIVADSGSEPKEMFASICRQVHSVGLAVPANPSKPRFSQGSPAIAITLLPRDDTPGALESLYAEEIRSRHPGVETCVNAFLRCDPITAYAWPAEKLDKARYECMVAALNKDDPSKAVSRALQRPRPVVQIGSRVFDDIAKRVRDFCELVQAGPA